MTHTLLAKIDSLLSQERPFRFTAHDIRAQTFPTVLLKGLDPSVVRGTLEQIAEDLAKSEWQGAATRETLTEARRHLAQFFETVEATKQAHIDAERDAAALVSRAEMRSAEMLARAEAQIAVRQANAEAALERLAAQTREWETAGAAMLRFLQVTTRDITTGLDAAARAFPELDMPAHVLPAAVLHHEHGGIAGPSHVLRVKPDTDARMEFDATDARALINTLAHPSAAIGSHDTLDGDAGAQGAGYDDAHNDAHNDADDDARESSAADQSLVVTAALSAAAAYEAVDEALVVEDRDDRGSIFAEDDRETTAIATMADDHHVEAERSEAAAFVAAARLPWPTGESAVPVEITSEMSDPFPSWSLVPEDEVIMTSDDFAGVGADLYALPTTPAHWPIGLCVVPQIGLVPFRD